MGVGIDRALDQSEADNRRFHLKFSGASSPLFWGLAPMRKGRMQHRPPTSLSFPLSGFVFYLSVHLQSPWLPFLLLFCRWNI
jgi:hypothetical protein